MENCWKLLAIAAYLCTTCIAEKNSNAVCASLRGSLKLYTNETVRSTHFKKNTKGVDEKATKRIQECHLPSYAQDTIYVLVPSIKVCNVY